MAEISTIQSEKTSEDGSLRLPVHKLVGELGEEPCGCTHWIEGLLGFLHLLASVAAGLIKAQEFGEGNFVM